MSPLNLVIDLSSNWLSAEDEKLTSLLELSSLKKESLTLHRTFNLEPLDDCIHYFLDTDSKLNNCRILINNQLLNLSEKSSWGFDVTMLVWLHDNKIQLESNQMLSDLTWMKLTIVPCDEL
ncbi:hypothetical protein MASR2M15_24890 [Anaerolineales bacterium]